MFDLIRFDLPRPLPPVGYAITAWRRSSANFGIRNC